MNARSSLQFLALLLVFSTSILAGMPTFAQLEEVSAPTVEPAPEPSPVAEPAPEPVPETEGLEPEVQTTTEVSNTSVETSTSVSTDSGVSAEVTVTDTVAPAISGVADLSLGLDEATIVWTTDELAVSRLEYGTTESYGKDAALDATAALAHTAVLLNLTPNTTYYYCIHATDLAGNTRNSCGHTFRTADHAIIVDTTPPNVTLITVTPVTTTSATINFTTDKVGNARVEYGTTAGYGETTPLDTLLSLNHSVTLSNLTPNTEYHYRIITSDELGNETITSDETFMTEALTESASASAGSAQASASVAISAVEVTSITETSVTITWHTDLPSDSQVEYGDSENFGSLSAPNSSLTTSHSATLTGLTPNTNYIFRVKSKPSGASASTISGNHEFNTLNHSIPVVAPADITSVASRSVTDTSATITWTTDKGATSQVEYGTNTAYGSLSVEKSALTTSHSVTLSGLESGTTYHYRALSEDEAGNLTVSIDYTFTTSGTASRTTPAEEAPVLTDEIFTPVVDADGADSQIVFEIHGGSSSAPEDVVIERDGEVIYEGNSHTFTDTELENGHTYSYQVYARGTRGRSNAVRLALAPIAGVKEVQYNRSGTLSSSTPVFHFVHTWKRGDKDIEIEHLQEILVADKDSYPEKYVTGYFGPLTEAALRRFQRKHGLAQSGVVDEATQNKLHTVSHSETKLNVPTDYVVFSTDLKRGDEGRAVKDLQQYLAYEGSYTEALITGYFGVLTESAVKKFQLKYGISPVSGYVGSRTRHKMQQLIGL